MPAQPRLRLFRCPVCGASGYRWRSYEDMPQPYGYKGLDRPVPVICGVNDCPAVMDQDFTGINFDLLPEGFEVDGETIGREPGKVRISSLQELRAIERESEAKFRNGEGQIVNFRTFSQNDNNHTNSFEGSSYQTGKSRLPEKRTTGRTDALPIHVQPVAPGVH